MVACVDHVKIILALLMDTMEDILQSVHLKILGKPSKLFQDLGHAFML
jgi:hypothetical protein